MREHVEADERGDQNERDDRREVAQVLADRAPHLPDPLSGFALASGCALRLPPLPALAPALDVVAVPPGDGGAGNDAGVGIVVLGGAAPGPASGPLTFGSDWR